MPVAISDDEVEFLVFYCIYRRALQLQCACGIAPELSSHNIHDGVIAAACVFPSANSASILRVFNIRIQTCFRESIVREVSVRWSGGVRLGTFGGTMEPGDKRSRSHHLHPRRIRRPLPTLEQLLGQRWLHPRRAGADPRRGLVVLRAARRLDPGGASSTSISTGRTSRSMSPASRSTTGRRAIGGQLVEEVAQELEIPDQGFGQTTWKRPYVRLGGG